MLDGEVKIPFSRELNFALAGFQMVVSRLFSHWNPAGVFIAQIK